MSDDNSGQEQIVDQIINVKRRYTKNNIERRTKEKIVSSVKELKSLWEQFLVRAETVTLDKEHFKTVQSIYSDHLEYFNNEFRELNKIENIVPLFRIPITNALPDNISSLPTVELSSKMSASKVKEIFECANKCIPIFSAEGTMLKSEISNFIACCDIVLNIFPDDPDQQIFFNIIKTRLKGRAFEVVGQTEFKSIKELERVLKDYFIPKTRHADIRAQLTKTKQFPYESVFEYGKRVSNVLYLSKESIREKYSTAPEVVTSLLTEEESVAERCFRNGLLDKDIGLRLSCLKLDYLKQSVEKALQIDSEEKEVKKEQKFESSTDTVGNKCNVCGKIGHTTNNCWYAPSTSSANIFSRQQSFPNFSQNYGSKDQPDQIPKSNNPFSNPFQKLPNNDGSLQAQSSKMNSYSRDNSSFSDFRNKSVVVCYKCGRKGHMSRSCRLGDVEAQVRSASNSIPFCQFCKVGNHATVDCQQFSNCLKTVLLQTSENCNGHAGDTTAGVHKTQ